MDYLSSDAEEPSRSQANISENETRFIDVSYSELGSRRKWEKNKYVGRYIAPSGLLLLLSFWLGRNGFRCCCPAHWIPLRTIRAADGVNRDYMYTSIYLGPTQYIYYVMDRYSDTDIECSIPPSIKVLLFSFIFGLKKKKKTGGFSSPFVDDWLCISGFFH